MFLHIKSISLPKFIHLVIIGTARCMNNSKQIIEKTMINEAVSVGVLTPTEIRQVIQGLTVSLLPPEEVGVLDPVSHRIKFITNLL